MQIIKPRVFISYSWTTKDYEDWVLELANRLMENGVAVTLDKKEGHDKYAFFGTNGFIIRNR